MPIKRKDDDKKLFGCCVSIRILSAPRALWLTLNYVHFYFPSAYQTWSIQSNCQLRKGLLFGMTLELSTASPCLMLVHSPLFGSHMHSSCIITCSGVLLGVYFHTLSCPLALVLVKAVPSLGFICLGLPRYTREARIVRTETECKHTISGQ